MDKKKALIGFGCVALFSCGLSPSRYFPHEFSPLVDAPFQKEEGNGYYRLGDISPIESKDGSLDWSFYDVFHDGKGGISHYAIPSTGEVNMLVIPVDFEEYPGDDETLESIKKAFMGRDLASSSYYSVASYFEKASYGRLHLVSEIAPSYFRCPVSYQALASQKDARKNKTSLSSIYEAALDWYEDLNEEGYQKLYDESPYHKIPVHFVYTAPYSGYGGGESNRDSMLWAFTISTPAPICWSSAKMMEVSQGGCDAHTFIHETGHLLGLKDYYDTSYSSTKYSPLSPMGRADMMDCSMGDENSYSKFLLDWCRPYVPTSSCEITLRPFSGNGDFILLSPHFDGTPFEEYVLLEFYTPTYLNGADAHLRDSKTMSLPKTCGVKALKVDSRLGLFKGTIREGILDENTSIGDRRLDIAFDNSHRDMLLLQQLDKSSGSMKLDDYFIASDKNEDVAEDGLTWHLRDAYFHEGEGFDGTNFSDFRFHDGSSLPFQWKVKKMTATYATIQIEKVG